MGITDSRSILASIESQYKSLRKYCDPAYGQITVIQHKTSKKLFALIQKTFLKSNGSIPNFLAENAQEQYILKPQNHYVCDLSLCSDIRLYFFLFEYQPNNLQQEITQRMQENRPFRREEAVNVFLQQLDIIMGLRAKVNPEFNKPYKLTISNNNFLCSPLLDLKVLEPVFKNHPQTLEDIDKVYLSPEAYQVMLNGQSFRLKQILSRQSSMVFTLAVNFMELLLLADLSIIYQQCQQQINYERVNEACQQIKQRYGSQLHDVLMKMLQSEQSKRPGLAEVKRLLRNNKKSRRSITRYQKDKESSTEVY